MPKARNRSARHRGGDRAGHRNRADGAAARADRAAAGRAAADRAVAGEPVEAIRRSLVELRRLFQRKELAAMWAAAAGGPRDLDYTELRVLDALREGGTVGDVAVGLGIDPSRASRLVARAVARGTLAREAAQDDGRKVVLRVTAAGARLRARGSELTRARIALATAGWSRADRERFAELFARFAAAMIAPG